MTPGWTASGDGPMVLHVRLLVEPCLWCWEIRDEVSGALIEGSWANGWTAYPSLDLARAAGEARLAEIAEALRPGGAAHRPAAPRSGIPARLGPHAAARRADRSVARTA